MTSQITAADTQTEYLNMQLAKIGNNWSSGRDEQFGGRFVCVHGLSQEEADSLIAAGKAALAKTGGA